MVSLPCSPPLPATVEGGEWVTDTDVPEDACVESEEVVDANVQDQVP